MNRHLLRLSTGLVALALAGCSHVSKIDTGPVTIKERLRVTVSQPWNQFEHGLADDTPTWTQDGFTVDALRFYVGVADGRPVARAAGGSKTEPAPFRAGMQPADIVKLFEALNTRDGSSFQLDRLAPADFAGGRGFRWEYSVVRKLDDVPLRGLGYGVVHNGQLFAITYTAPRLAFFPRYQALVEALMRSAAIAG